MLIGAVSGMKSMCFSPEDAMGKPRFALIPARSGSKRVENKNIRKINGRSLIERAIDAALGCSLDVIFSSDSSDYCELVENKYGSSVEIDLRDPSLAGDKVKVVDLIEAILESRQLSNDDFFSMLLPTSPFRDEVLMRSILKKWSRDGVGYFSAATYNFAVQFGFSTDQSGSWEPLFGYESPMRSGNTRSQDQLKYLHPTGGVYIQRVGAFSEKKSLYHNARAFEVDQIQAFDIDSEIDFVMASAIAQELNL